MLKGFHVNENYKEHKYYKYIVHCVAMVASFDGEWMVEERRLAVTLTSTGNLYS